MTTKVECEFCHELVYLSDYHSKCSHCGKRLRVPGGAETRRAVLSEAEVSDPTGDPFPYYESVPAPAVMDASSAVVYGADDGNRGTRVSLPTHCLRAVLVVDRGERGQERHVVREAISFLGRTEGFPRSLNIPMDHLLSAAHAKFSYSGGKLVVRDNDSLNGVYLKVEGQAPLRDRQRIRMGSLLFRFEVLGPAAREQEQGEGASPGPASARLVVIGDGGEDGPAYDLIGEKTLIGRESGAHTFPGDRLLSGRHAQFETIDGVFQVENLSQANGTFVQIDERTLEQGDTLLIGAQIIRVEYE